MFSHQLNGDVFNRNYLTALLWGLFFCVVCETCPTLFSTPWTTACQAPLSVGFPRQEYLEGLPFPFPGDLPDPEIKPASSALPLSHRGSPLGRFKWLNTEKCLEEGLAQSHNTCVCLCFVVQSCPTLCHPMECSPPGSSVHGILQARILEWVAVPFSRGSSQPRDRGWVFCIAGRFFTIWATREIHTLCVSSLLFPL